MSDDHEGERENYEVGYGKPPKHTQFKKGQSGNPKGKPKGHKNFKTDLKEALGAKIPITIDGKKKSITKQRAIIESTIHRSLQGNDKARANLFSLIIRSLEADVEAEEMPDLTAQDLEILKRYETRLTERVKSDLKDKAKNHD